MERSFGDLEEIKVVKLLEEVNRKCILNVEKHLMWSLI